MTINSILGAPGGGEAKPAVAVNLEGIPEELRARPQWVVWRLRPKDGEPGEFDKIPYSAAHPTRRASSTDSTTWTVYALAGLAISCRAEQYGIAGIGFVLSADDPYVGIDLDGCRDLETGELDAWATEIVERLGTYAEISPSGTGLKLWIRQSAAWDGKGRKKKKLGRGHCEIERYSEGRYFTVTGHALEGYEEIVENDEGLREVFAKYFPPKPKPAPKPDRRPHAGATLDDDQVVEKMFASKNGAQARALWDGDTSAHGGDASRADLALANAIAFYVGPDPARVEAIFSRSALADREKWQTREKYRAWTCERACERTDFYSSSSATRGTDPDADEAADLSGEDFTDLRLAERFAGANRERLRFCESFKRWIYWDGSRWTFEYQGAALQCSKKVALEMLELAEENGDKLLIARAREALSRRSLEAVVGLAKADDKLNVRPEELDQHRMLLGVRNGVVNLRTGELLEPSPDLLLTKSAGVEYEEGATCPRWERFLLEVFDGDEELVEFVRRAAGYSLTSDTRERVFFVLHGTGRNGKSVFLEVLRELLGDYAVRTPVETLLAKRGGEISNDIARLRGSRFVFASESDAGRKLDAALVKSLTGREAVSARFLYGEFFDFVPEFKLWFATNHQPRVDSDDDALWDRLRLLPFNVRFEGDREDKSLPLKLRGELRGILRWAVEGALAWQREGLTNPPIVEAATSRYRTDMDDIGAFLAECCIVSPAVGVGGRELYERFREFAKTAGAPLSNRAFSQKLQARGFCKVKRSRIFWEGIGLLAEREDGNDHAAAPADGRDGSRGPSCCLPSSLPSPHPRAHASGGQDGDPPPISPAEVDDDAERLRL